MIRCKWTSRPDGTFPWKQRGAGARQRPEPQVVGRTLCVDYRAGDRFNLTKLVPMLEDVHERLAGVFIDSIRPTGAPMTITVRPFQPPISRP